jgi:outer membrane protein assembly factor BamB
VASPCDPPPDGGLAGTVGDLSQAHARGGEELVGHRKAEAVVCDADGIVVAGTVSGAGGRERTLLLRLSDDGEVVWEREHAAGAARALAAHPDGGFVVAGDAQRGPLEYEGLLLRLDAEGAVVDEQRRGSAGATGFTSVAVLAGGVVLAGGMERGRGYLAAGEWSSSLGDVATVAGLAALPAGGFALAGVAEASPVALGMTRVAAFRSVREVRWASSLPEAGRGEPAGIAAVGDDLVLVGHRSSGAEPARLWVTRLDAAGRPRWERLLGDEREEHRGRAVASLPDGDLAVAGDAARGGRRGVRVARLAADGTTVWEQSFGEGEQDLALALAATADGGLVVVGSTLDGKTQGRVRRLDAAGELVWSRVF